VAAAPAGKRRSTDSFAPASIAFATKSSYEGETTMKRVLLGVLLLLVACDYRPPPTGPTTVTTTVTVTTNNPTPNPGTPVPAPVPVPTPLPAGPRTPDPSPAGATLPLPPYGQQVLQSYATTAPAIAALAAPCSAGISAFTFIDGLVDVLRTRDTRWGYACKRGNCAEIASDVVSYHASAGPDLTGVAGVINVDVVQDSCGKPVAQWAPFTYDPSALWSTRGRF
jgi:hypothetical protein